MPKSLWTTEMESQSGESRICALTSAKRTLFAVSAATHALTIVKGARALEWPAEFGTWEALVDEFWAGFPATADGPVKEILEERVTAIVQEEAGPSSDGHLLQTPGAEQMMWATLYALSSDRPDDPGSCNAYSSASASYQCVFSVFAKSPFATFESQALEEWQTCESVAEIQFQLRLLTIVESIGKLCNYQELIRQL